jgi:CheY-like chemotaxis protein
MEYVVNHAGCNFIAIQDPLKALGKIIKYKPDLIFLDLMMPIINGYEMCAQIRRISQLQDIPILILTSNDGVIDRVRAKIVGASAFLSKPINEEKVIEKINYFLSPKSIELKPDKSLNQLKINSQTTI